MVLTSIATNLTNGIKQSAVIPQRAKAVISQAVAGHAGEVQFGTQKQQSGVNPVIAKEIVAISHQATVDANKTAMDLMAGFVFLTLLLSLQLPNVKNVESGKHATAAH